MSVFVSCAIMVVPDGTPVPATVWPGWIEPLTADAVSVVPDPVPVKDAQVKAEKADEFAAAAKAVIAASRAEPGNISYTLLQDAYDKTTFFFFEEWKSQKAIDEHFATPHFKAFGAQLKDFLAGAPAITIYACPAEKKVGE